MLLSSWRDPQAKKIFDVLNILLVIKWYINFSKLFWYLLHFGKSVEN